MSVTISIIPNSIELAYRNPAPRFPAAMWIASAGGQGDASGGTVLLDILVAPADAGAGMFSIEGLTTRVSASLSVSVGYSISGFGGPGSTFSNGLTPLWSRQVSLTNQGTLGRSDFNGAVNGVESFPWPLATRAKTAMLIALLYSNNSNGDSYEAMAWGYRWGPQVLDLGGPLKPGMFSPPVP